MLDTLAAVGSFLSGLAALFALAALTYQLRQAGHAQRASGTMQLAEYLTAEGVKTATEALGRLGHKPLTDWTDDERREARNWCNAFDVAGILTEKRYADRQVVLENWGTSIVLHWRIAEPFVRQVRERAFEEHGVRPETYWDNLELLTKDARPYGPVSQPLDGPSATRDVTPGID